jgi:predicted unusual protein kinase regulating ubiquinone biosynthesis (AarF/ABC1/UbiB family)
MYHDVAYRNDELNRDLEQASREAAKGWRFRHLPRRESSLLTNVMTVLGGILVAVGQWLSTRGRSTLASST